MIQLQPWAKPFTLWWELLNLAIAYYAEKYDPPDQIYRIRHITIPEEWL